jgi:hypothetical protein
MSTLFRHGQLPTCLPAGRLPTPNSKLPPCKCVPTKSREFPLQSFTPFLTMYSFLWLYLCAMENYSQIKAIKMKTLIFLFAISFTVFAGCKKADYNCQQKITTSMSHDSTGFPNIQYSEFQLTGKTTCLVGTTSTDTPLNRSMVKTVKIETTCD